MSDYGSTPPPDPNDPSGQPPFYGQQPSGQFGQGQFGAPGQQPSYGGGQETPPNNYLVPAILSTIFCCLPLGVASIVFAAQVNSKHASGDYAGARDASEKAKKFALWGAIIGGIVNVLLFVVYFAAIMSQVG